MAEEIVKNTEELGSKLWDLRNQNLCCDAMLIMNGKRIHVHAAVLASSNEFFKNYLCNENASSNEIPFNDLNEETLLSVIEYFYKGYIKLTEKNVMDVLKIANKLNIPFLIEKSSKYMAKILNTENSISLFKMSQKSNMETLKNVVLSFIEKNFDKVFHAPEFLTLEYSDLKEILDLKMKYVSEKNVYEAIKRWIKHDTSRDDNLIDLLNRVKLECLPMDFLLSESSSVCGKNAECFQMFLNAISTQRSNTKLDCVDLRNTLFVIGGESAEMTKHIEVFDINKKTWTEINHDFNRTRFAAALLNKKIMISGGLKNGVVTNTTEYYDIETGLVEILPSMKYKRHSASSVKLNDDIYVIGGSANPGDWTGLAHVEKWSITSKTWKDAAPMNIFRLGHSTTLLGEKIYVIGGCRSSEFGYQTDTVEFYNPTNNTWKVCKSMHKKRYYPAVGVLGGLIYVAGGFNSTDLNLKSAEKYDPVADTWTLITSIEVARERFSGGILNGQFVIVGGHSLNGPTSTVEAYDERNNRWKQMSPLKRAHFDHYVLEVPWKLAQSMLDKK